MLHHYGVVPEASSTILMVPRRANKAKWLRPLPLIFLLGPGDDGQGAFWDGSVS